MSRVPFRSRHFSRSIVYTTLGCSIFIGFRQWHQTKLLTDSSSREQWPKARSLVAGPSGKVPSFSEQIRANSTQERSDTQGSVASKEEDVPLFEDEDSAAWASFSTRFAAARKSLTAIEWSALRGKMADYVLPEWALVLPDYVAKLRKEMEMGPDSLAFEIWVCASWACAFAPVPCYQRYALDDTPNDLALVTSSLIRYIDSCRAKLTV